LIAGLAELRPDLVAFQEAVFSYGYNQAADLLGASFEYAHQTHRSGAETEGVVVASRWPIRAVDEVDLHVTSRTAGDACTALVTEIEVAEAGDVLFVNHKPSWQRDFELERELQAAAVARYLEQRVGERNLPVILAGDLDAEPASASVRFLTGRQSLGGTTICYEDAWTTARGSGHGPTWASRNPLVAPEDSDRRIDYIFLRRVADRRMLGIRDCRLCFDEPVDGTWVSDHFGVLADLEPRSARPSASAG